MSNIRQREGTDPTVTSDTGSSVEANWEPEGIEHKLDGKSILVGIPAFNEEASIGSTVLATRQYTSHIVVVDDGSEDRTGEFATLAGAKLITHDENKGKGAALQTLFEYAQTAEYDALVLLDGDGQHLPKDVPKVVEPVVDGTADLVIGNRYSVDGNDDETPRYRRFGQKILDHLTHRSSGIDVSDSQSGFRALSPEAVERISINSSGYGVESEMLTAASQVGLDVTERPIDVRYESVEGQTYNPLRHGISVVNSILHVVRDRRPLLFFGVPGLLLTTLGFLYGVQAILIYRATGDFYPDKVMISGFLVVIGVLSSFCGLLLNQMAHVISRAVANSNR